MRRTYRSKKETGGALDHKDAIQAMDEKSSAFDAFYIQNIKQTKRDLSCIGSSNHYGAASNKVRKRKYVKRIIKDPELTIRTSPSHLVFLTPDKSIRVNKAQDIFDQLLNSFSPQKNDSSRNSKNNNRFPYKQEGKTYTRKKMAKIKKLNCSSSDSIESDKENSNENQNVTDLRSYELLIEKERKPSPKYLDKSINKIVKSISCLISNRNPSIGSAKKVYHIKHRLTTNVPSPSSSPLCSTPFKEKFRGQSIYKFSPISFKTDASPDYVTIVAEKVHDSLVLVDKEPELQNISHCEDNPPSPIIHLSTDKCNKSDNKTHSTNSQIPIDLTHHKTLESETSNSKHVEISTIEISDLQTTEAEPFLGFSNVEPLNFEIDNCNIKENSINGNDVTQNKSKSENSEDSQSIIENVTCNEVNTTNSTLLEIEEAENESSYDTCSEQLSDNVNTVKVPVVRIERLDCSIMQAYLNKMGTEQVEDDIDKVEFNDSEGDTSHDMSNELDSDDYASFEASHSSTHSDKSSNVEQEMLMDENNSIETSDIDSSIEKSSEDMNSNEEEKCVSFVTTRRRNEMTNDSLIFSYNNSFGSSSSTDCNKTVLSNIESSTTVSVSPNVKKQQICNDIPDNEMLLSDKTIDEEDTTKLRELENTDKVNVISKMATRKSTRLARESNAHNSIRNSMIDDGKPGIVLQPGKKWERSLSIYRRMTMMTDSFDKSILDDEELITKGRKYRQSIISTMELQEKGSLHNESIISRRSTFVSKPCRSTIRIIKEPNSSRLSLCTSAVSDDLRGFLNEDCDDTIIELSKLSIADSEHEVTVIENFHDTSNRVSTARDYVLRRCGQSDAIVFDECYPETVLKNCRKIGEGVYGEVFLWRAGDGRARVMKIVPIAGTTKVNGEHQKDFQEIISEIVIAMELSALRAPIDEIQREFDEGKSIDSLDLHSVENATDVFNQVLAVRCVSGAYPSRLLDLWELYDECRGSENDNPAVLPVDQQYLVLELANAGQDLESYEFNSAEQAHALFLQVAFGLAVGEEAYQFEHRDLHWGNVLIAPTDQKFATFVLRGRAHRVARCGVAGTIIDYSLSRLSLPLPGAGDAAALYNDLAADDSLFDAVGDYQFQVYRLMRDKLGNDWKNFEPYTNILWLHYTVDKMITALRYKRTNTKIHKHYIAKLKGIKNRLLDYGSAAQFVLTDNEF